MLYLVSFIASQFSRERERWVLWLPVCLGIGVALYFSLESEPAAWIGLLGVVLTVGAVFFGRRNFAVLCGCLGALAISLGFTAAQWRTMSVAHPVLEKRVGPTSATGRILFVENFDKGPRVTLENSIWECFHRMKRLRKCA